MKLSIKKRNKRRAFSLMEVMFGIVIASMMATLLASTMPIANNSRKKASYNNKALSLAQKEMEAIRSVGYQNLTASLLFGSSLLDNTTPVSGTTYSFTNVDNGMFDNPSSVLPSGQGFVTIDQLGIDLKRVTIEVRWVDRGKNQSLKLTASIANL